MGRGAGRRGFYVKHWPGQLNMNTEALSRQEFNLMSLPTTEEEREHTEYIKALDD